ncbi:hypothetical protein NECID01_1106 [Nematocida sp. AWRm77]|nr:hypothetical protein NECID01_1106 [Nematocida sp. AWRm77]
MEPTETSILKSLGIKKEKEVQVWAIKGPRGKERFIPNKEAFYVYVRERILRCVGEAEGDTVRARTYGHKVFPGMVVQDGPKQPFYLLYVTKNLGVEAVLLNLEGVSAYSLFSGQVVKIVGKNQFGNAIDVESIDLFVDIDLFEYAEEKKPFSFSIATLSGREDAFESLGKITTDLCIVIGDFSAGKRKACRKSVPPRTRLVFVPPIGGLHTSMMFPARFAEESAEKPVCVLGPVDVSEQKSIEMCNPGVVYANGVSIGVCTYDTLLDIYSLSRAKEKKKSMEDLLTHMVYQKAFLITVPKNTPVDYTQWPHLVHPHILDVLVVTSRIDTSCTEIQQTTVIPTKPGVHSFYMAGVVDGRAVIHTMEEHPSHHPSNHINKHINNNISNSTTIHQ